MQKVSVHPILTLKHGQTSCNEFSGKEQMPILLQNPMLQVLLSSTEDCPYNNGTQHPSS
jgi:hypothetical protein